MIGLYLNDLFTPNFYWLIFHYCLEFNFRNWFGVKSVLRSPTFCIGKKTFDNHFLKPRRWIQKKPLDSSIKTYLKKTIIDLVVSCFSVSP